jgi:MbtH protein
VRLARECTCGVAETSALARGAAIWLEPEREIMQYPSMSEEREDVIYKVVVNHEEQYSIWPADRENPLGWRDAGKSGTKAECLSHIKEVWTDMRPLSLRQKLSETGSP